MIMNSQPFDVLVVDDDPSVFDLLYLIGRKEFQEATFISAVSPQDAISYLDKQLTVLPRLILLDIDFRQEMDGFILLSLLQARFKRKVPIVILSRSGKTNYVYQAYQAGAIAYTQKPDKLEGWKNYIIAMKRFWYDTSTLPPLA